MVLTGEAQVGHKRKVFAKNVVQPWDGSLGFLSLEVSQTQPYTGTAALPWHCSLSCSAGSGTSRRPLLPALLCDVAASSSPSPCTDWS